MSEEKHCYTLQSAWTGDSDGDGTITTSWGGAVDYGVPADLGGKAGRSNPEEMLLASVTACYSITLSLLAEKRRLPLCRIEVRSEGEVVRQPDKTLKFTAIRLFPRLILKAANEEQQNAAQTMAHKAEVYCVISRALRGNVEMTITPEILNDQL